MDENKNPRAYALVTGGSRGIGRAICLKLAAQGYFVLVNFQRNETAADKTVAMIKEAGGAAQCYKIGEQRSLAGIGRKLRVDPTNS